MSINALVIDVLDPGAVPGGSTTNASHLPPLLARGRLEAVPGLGGVFLMGPIQDRQAFKGVSFASVRDHRYRFKTA